MVGGRACFHTPASASSSASASPRASWFPCSPFCRAAARFLLYCHYHDTHPRHTHINTYTISAIHYSLFTIQSSLGHWDTETLGHKTLGHLDIYKGWHSVRAVLLSSIPASVLASPSPGSPSSFRCRRCHTATPTRQSHVPAHYPRPHSQPLPRSPSSAAAPEYPPETRSISSILYPACPRPRRRSHLTSTHHVPQRTQPS